MYGKWLYKEIGTEYGACKVEIYRKNYTGVSIEIGALAANSLSIALENLGSITDPIGKSVCSFSIIDTDQVEYDDFFTPDATALKVVVSTRVGSGAYVTRWSGYVTPDFFAENLSYRTPISISARDNIGYLNDVDFDLIATTITVREFIQSAFRRIAEDYPMSLSFVTQKQTAEGILAIDATISTTLLREMSWGEALETILHDLGLQMRWVDNNTIAVLDLSQIPEYYATQGFNFIDASGYREIVPAWRELSQEQNYGVRENFFEGWLREDNITFVKTENIRIPLSMGGVTGLVPMRYYTPNNWGVAGNTFAINPKDYVYFGTYGQMAQPFGERIFFTGVEKDATNIANNYMSYRQDVYASNRPMRITFKAFTSVMATGGIGNNDALLAYDPANRFMDFATGDTLQLGLKVNLLLHVGTRTYILGQNWEEINGAETNSLYFVLPKIGQVDGNSVTPNEEEITIDVNTIPNDGVLELRIYGFTIHNKTNLQEDAGSATYDWLRMVSYINEVKYTYNIDNPDTGRFSQVEVNKQHNIKDTQSYTFGQIPVECGAVNAFAGGLFKADGNELIGFQRNANATNYNLLELVGRELIHFNKKNYNRLSGTIRNLNKEPLMFNRLFVREGKKYAPYNYSLNVISNEMNITSMQEVELYTTANFSEVHSEVSTGGSTVSSGNNQILQYSAEVGNAKRLYELQTISENEKPDAYVLVDGAGYPEARKLKLTDIAGLDEKALEQYLVQYKYLQEGDLTPIIQDFEKLEEEVNPLFGYFDATGNANNALRLGGHSADYFATATSVSDLSTELGKLSGNLSTAQTDITTLKGYFTSGKANYAIKDKNGNDIVDTYATKTSVNTIANNLADVTGRVDVAEDALKTYGDSIAKNAADIAANADAIGKLETRVTTLEDLGLVRVRVGSTYYIKSIYSIVSEGELISGRRASGSSSDVTGGGGISQVTAQMIVDALGYVPYSSQNPSGYITSSALNGYATQTWVEGKKYLTAIPSEYITETELSNTLGSYQTKITSSNKLAYSLISGTPSLATVATSGKYSDLSGTPSSLPASDVSAWAKKSSLAAADVPNLDWSKITSGKPTTLGGYGITDALPLSGGTINGNIVWGKGKWGVDASARGVFMSWNDSNYLHITNDGAFYNWNTLIHSGNIGSQSVNYANSAGNADTLDTLHSIDFVRSLIDVGANAYKGNALGYTYATEAHGGAYAGGFISFGNGIYGCQINGSFDGSGLAFRGLDNGVFSSWKTVAFTDSNVASATKLQTARTIWGQSFDGTGNVSGGLADVTSILFNTANGIGIYRGSVYSSALTATDIAINGGKIVLNPTGNVLIGTTTDSSAKLRVQTNRIDTFTWNLGSLASKSDMALEFYENSSNIYGLYTAINYLSGDVAMQVGRSDGVTSAYNLILNPLGGNVLIGTTTDNGYKLDVNGGSLRLCAAIGSTDNTVAAFYTYPNNPYGLQMRANTGSGDTYLQARREGKAEYFNLVLEPDGGNVLIGATTETIGKLQVEGSIYASSWLRTKGSTGWYSQDYGGGIYMEDSTYVRVYNGKSFRCDGNIVALGELISSRRATASDARLKDNINRLIAEDCLAMVRNLHPSSWDWKNDGKHSLGFIAQDVEQCMPYAVTKIKDDKLGEKLNLQYDQFFAPVVGAIQCLDSEVEQLKKRVKYLENKLQEYGYNRY